jgi:hypothetical protein
MKTAQRLIHLLSWVALMAVQPALAQTPPNWSSLGTGVNDRVYALLVSGSNVYAAGKFTTADGSTANRVAKWDGTNWTPLGSGMNGPVYALAMWGTNLCAGGSFTSADGNLLNKGLAKWNGSNWSPVGSSFYIYSAQVQALAVIGNTLYAGGVIGSSPLASYDGFFWSTTIGNGLNGSVYALAVSGSNLYAGGTFTAPLNCIAKWNGSFWSALGTGMSGTDANMVDALAVSGSNVYAGGDFTQAGSTPAGSIAKWNGSSWSSLGIGVSGSNVHALVNTMAASGNDLYVGGDFRFASGVAADRIAKWNGNSWSALGSGMNSNVFALAVSGNDVYAGGDFTTAGGNASARVAKATIVQAPLPGRFSSPVYSLSTGFSCTFLDASVGQSYRIEASTSLSPPDWSEFTNFIYAGPILLVDSSVLLGTNKFFRAVTP